MPPDPDPEVIHVAFAIANHECVMPPASAPPAIRARLRALVARDGRPVAAIAAAAGMSANQLYQVLNGGRANPTVQTVGRILEALGARWADLD